MKAHEKKKLYRKMLREQIKNDKMPNGQGGWMPMGDSTTGQHLKSGWHLA